MLINAEFYRVVWTKHALLTIHSEMLPFSGNNQNIKNFGIPLNTLPSMVIYIMIICHWAISHYNMSFKTIVGRSDGVFWWFPVHSEDQEKNCCIYQNYLVALMIFGHKYALKPQDSFGKKDKTFSWSAESAAHRQKTLINLPALALNDVFSCNNVKWLNIAMYMYITYGRVFVGGLRTFWYLSYFLKMKAIWSKQWTGHLYFIQIYKIMHWQKKKLSLLIFLSYTQTILWL